MPDFVHVTIPDHALTAEQRATLLSENSSATFRLIHDETIGVGTVSPTKIWHAVVEKHASTELRNGLRAQRTEIVVRSNFPADTINKAENHVRIQIQIDPRDFTGVTIAKGTLGSRHSTAAHPTGRQPVAQRPKDPLATGHATGILPTDPKGIIILSEPKP